MLIPSADRLPSDRAAPFLASLVACGLVGRAEVLAAFLQAAAPSKSFRCLRYPGANHVPPDIRRRRSMAALAARQALAPLLAARVPNRILLTTAVAAAGPILRRREVESLVTDIVARHLRKARHRVTVIRNGGHEACGTCAIQPVTLKGHAA